MKFLEKLFGNDGGSKLHGKLEQPEREAIIDLLLLGIYIDNHISFNETTELDSSTEALGWNSPTGLSVYLSNATSRARNARNSEDSIDEFIAFAAERLNSGESRERALELLNKLLISDGKTGTEKTFFKKVEAVFGS